VSLRSSEIAAVAAELAPLAGARVDSVRVHAERLVTFELRGAGGEATLLLSAEPDLTRIHAASWRPPSSPEPLAFQVLLRRELAGARLSALEARAGDRVVLLHFERAAGPLSLVAELTGRHGNLLLVDGAGVIRALAGRNLSERRVLAPGQPYQPPGAREGEGGAPRFTPVPGTRFPLSTAIEAHYRRLEEERALGEARRRLRDPLRAAVARSRRALERLADEAARVPAAEGDRRAADLLKQNLHAVARGAREVALTEWTADGPRSVTLALDPALPPRENMERLYRRYRRIVESAARVEARAAEVRGRLAGTEALLAELDQAPQEALARLEREARRLGAAPRVRRPPRRKHDEPATPYRTFRSAAGLPILVGRGRAENDQLTVRVAKGNDLWLHARGRPGAHVVLRLQKGRAPDQESLLDAAHLAAHFSDARGEAAPEVVYTRVKHVRKPKGSAPGAVTYSQERALALRVEPARMERLVAGEAEGEEA
jgi:predicted ribosome quality control (RQC) complex YloA/Tae2 family protein